MIQLRPWVVVDVEWVERVTPCVSLPPNEWRVTVRHRDGTEGTGSHSRVSTAIFLAREQGEQKRADAKDARLAERIRRRLAARADR